MTGAGETTGAGAVRIASDRNLAPNQTPGLVCAHHHLYSALARGMPAPPATPHGLRRHPRAGLVATRPGPRPRDHRGRRPTRRARGARARVHRHHRPPRVARCDRGQPLRHRRRLRRGRRAGVVTAYGVTDRHGPDGAKAGLAENERFLADGGRGMVGVHAAFTCERRHDRRRGRARRNLGVGVHVHVCRGPRRRRRGRAAGRAHHRRLAPRPRRPPADRPRAVGDDRPQPPVEHEQRGRLRPSDPVHEPGRTRHRRHRRLDARRVPGGVRPAPRVRRDRVAGRRRGPGWREDGRWCPTPGTTS